MNIVEQTTINVSISTEPNIEAIVELTDNKISNNVVICKLNRNNCLIIFIVVK